MSGKFVKKISFVLSVFTFSILYSNFVFARRQGFLQNIDLGRILFFDIPIPQATGDTFTTPFLVFVMTWTLLFTIIYALVNWEQNPLQFLKEQPRFAKAFSIALAAMTMYVIPISGWLEDIISFFGIIGLIIAVVGIALLLATVLMRSFTTFSSAHTNMSKVLAENKKARAESVKLNRETVHNLNKAQSTMPDSEETIKKALQDIKIINIPSDPSIKDLSNILNLLSQIDLCLPVFENIGKRYWNPTNILPRNSDVTPFFYGQKEGVELISQCLGKVRKIRDFSIKMKGNSQDFKLIKEGEKFLKEILSNNTYRIYLSSNGINFDEVERELENGYRLLNDNYDVFCSEIEGLITNLTNFNNQKNRTELERLKRIFVDIHNQSQNKIRIINNINSALESELSSLKP